jgi:hypothetical protein
MPGSNSEGLEIWEQMMGRTHRELQMADEVLFDIYVACDYHRESLRRAVNAANQTPGGLKLAQATWV